MRRNLQHIELKLESGYSKLEEKTFDTAEGIQVKPTYSKSDIEEVEHLNFVAGIPPYLRGPYSTMYV